MSDDTRTILTGHNFAVATGIYLVGLASLTLKAAIIVTVAKQLWT